MGEQAPKKDWSLAEQVLKELKAKEVAKIQSPKPSETHQELLAKQRSGAQLSENEQVALQAFEKRDQQDQARRERMQQEKARLGEILKTRSLTDEERKALSKLISG